MIDVEGEGPLEHLDTGRHRRLIERPLDLGPAAVAARVDDPPVTVATLAAQRRAVSVVPRRIEGGSQAHQVADRRRRLGDELADDGLVAQPGAGGERVADVVLQRIGGVEHGGEAALGPRRGAGRQLALGDDQGAAHRPDGEGGRQTGGAGTDHHHIDVTLPGRRRGGELTRQSAHHRQRSPVTRRSATGCRWRSSARPTPSLARRPRPARRPRRRRRAATAAAWRA